MKKAFLFFFVAMSVFAGEKSFALDPNKWQAAFICDRFGNYSLQAWIYVKGGTEMIRTLDPRTWDGMFEFHRKFHGEFSEVGVVLRQSTDQGGVNGWNTDIIQLPRRTQIGMFDKTVGIYANDFFRFDVSTRRVGNLYQQKLTLLKSNITLDCRVIHKPQTGSIF